MSFTIYQADELIASMLANPNDAYWRNE